MGGSIRAFADVEYQTWKVAQIRNLFEHKDATSILATEFPNTSR